MTDYEIFNAGDVELQSGETLPGTQIAYKTYGTLNGDKSNVILCLVFWGGRHSDCEYFMAEGGAIDPTRYFIVIPNLTGNTLSSSPSNTPPPHDGPRFPIVTIYDNVQLQRRLLIEVLGIEKIALAFGHSMGAVQTFHWGALCPDMVERIAPICGASRCAVHAYAFLEGMKAVLRTDPAWREGDYDEPPAAGLRALGRAWSPWPPSQGFYREKKYETLGYESLEQFQIEYWEAMFLTLDANNIMAQILTWQAADISANPLYNGNFEDALAAIKAQAIVLPGRDDTYFPLRDSEYEAAHMPNAEFRPIPSIWGHWAGSGKNPEDAAFIEQALKDLLAR